MILGIDTSTTIASVALVERGQIICEESAPDLGPNGSRAPAARANHAEIVLLLIDKLLGSASLALADVSAFAVTIGPGSFTGLRIGLSTAKGLTFGVDVPVVGIPTLLALAARVNDHQGLICPLLDARKREVYAALFRRTAGGVERISDDVVATPDRVVESVRAAAGAAACLFIFGDGARVYKNVIEEGLGDLALFASDDSYPSTASAAARLGEQKILGGEREAAGSLAPVYLRPSEAELKRRA
ncbi:MAG: tRNA (adenosine(37)-N6)-threonylcarbamoyltransferase complex dimerization subunit type 1 TsaB [Deltaproteobacteria bacterium RIFCSPLOWO2_12_FULL_60_19]|nr:MAG: tRNA (adenosine(37)-N6)-threonylcarbamoyltransferase complex dimerization subunit type 1 TsaB [Deltaproteobacteria bacterium RIFCSPLOWO2_12_FULL_60_19]